MSDYINITAISSGRYHTSGPVYLLPHQSIPEFVGDEQRSFSKPQAQTHA